MSSTTYRAIKTSVYYCVFGFIWIFLSDLLLSQMIDVHEITHYQSVKGFVFIAITTVFVYLFVHKEISREVKLNHALQIKSNDLLKLSEEHQQINQILSTTLVKLEASYDDLKKSQLIYQTYINHSDKAIYRFELKEPISIKEDKDVQVNKILNDGILSQVNPAFCSLYHHLDNKQVLGKSIQTLGYYDKASEYALLIKQFVDSGYQLPAYESTSINAKNEESTFLRSVIGIVEDGCLTNIWVTKSDITAKRASENELIRAMKKAEENDQLKSAFLSNMSHEIRTPLNAILGFSEMLDDPDLKKKERRKFIKIINNNGNQLLRIISDILDISKLETAQLKIKTGPLSLNEMIDEIGLYLQNSVKTLSKDIRIDTIQALPQDEDWVVSDKGRLSQVITNLANNAVKFTEEGIVTIGYEIEKRKIRFFVRDTGKGIPQDKHAVVFDRFSQVEASSIRKYGGAGLGLPISKGIVELLKGTIGFSSTVNKGSEFYFNIPLKRP